MFIDEQGHCISIYLGLLICPPGNSLTNRRVASNSNHREFLSIRTAAFPDAKQVMQLV